MTNTYVKKCVSGNIDLQAKTVKELLPHTYAESYGALLLARPLFIEHGEVTRFADDLVALFGLLASLPQRCFGGDLRRYCAALGMDERLADLMIIGATGQPPLYARADAYHDGTSFKVLEFNVGSELGGIDAAQVNRAFMQADAFREFARQGELAYIDTAQRLAEALRGAGRTVTSGEPVVALIEGKDGLVEHRHVFDAIREAMRRYGVDLLLGEIDQVDRRNGKLTLNGVPFDVALRYFSTGQILDDPAARAKLELMMGAHAAGETAVFTPLEGALFASKGSLGLLHDPVIRREFTAGELEVVDRVVPWTRVVSASSNSMRGTDWDELVDRCQANRESLIAKPGIGYSGVGVVIGREVSDNTWNDTLISAKQQDYVIQQIVIPETEPVFDAESGLLDDWRANWGIFVTDDGYGGGFVRALKSGDGSVISYTNPGTRGTCVFTYPEHPSPAPSSAPATWTGESA